MFSKLIGNEQAKTVIKRLLSGGRIPNSLIFAGDDGIGKRQFALEIARAFVCSEPVGFNACGACPACRRADKFVFPNPDEKDDHKKVIFSGHPDIGTVISYKRNILIDAIRDLEKEANYNPYEAKARFFIIDDADKMNDAASNALLKTLEEPPSSSYIFLITSRPESFLPTIRSRCQLLRFAPVETEKVERFLIDGRAFTHDEARIAARLSRGSIGRAVSINVEQFRARRERMLGVVRNSIETGDKAALLRTSEEMSDAKNKDAFEENLEILESLIHDIWTLKLGGETKDVINTDLTADLTRLAKCEADLPAWLEELETLRQNLAVNINRKVATDALFVSMAAR